MAVRVCWVPSSSEGFDVRYSSPRRVASRRDVDVIPTDAGERPWTTCAPTRTTFVVYRRRDVRVARAARTPCVDYAVRRRGPQPPTADSVSREVRKSSTATRGSRRRPSHPDFGGPYFDSSWNTRVVLRPRQRGRDRGGRCRSNALRLRVFVSCGREDTPRRERRGWRGTGRRLEIIAKGGGAPAEASACCSEIVRSCRFACTRRDANSGASCRGSTGSRGTAHARVRRRDVEPDERCPRLRGGPRRRATATSAPTWRWRRDEPSGAEFAHWPPSDRGRARVGPPEPRSGLQYDDGARNPAAVARGGAPRGAGGREGGSGGGDARRGAESRRRRGRGRRRRRRRGRGRRRHLRDAGGDRRRSRHARGRGGHLREGEATSIAAPGIPSRRSEELEGEGSTERSTGTRSRPRRRAGAGTGRTGKNDTGRRRTNERKRTNDTGRRRTNERTNEQTNKQTTNERTNDERMNERQRAMTTGR